MKRGQQAGAAVARLVCMLLCAALRAEAQDLEAATHRIFAMDAGQGADGKVVSMADNNELFKNGESVAVLGKTTSSSCTAT